MKPKILIFSLGFYPKHIGGAEVAIKEITDRIGDDFEFHVLCNRYDTTLPKIETIGKVTVHRIGIATKNPSMGDLRKFPLHLNKLFYQFLAVHKAKQLHKKYSFGGIWAMMAHATGVPAGKFKKAFPDVKYVLTLQEGDPPEYIEKKMKIFGKAFDEAFLQADCIQVISNFLGAWAKRKGYTRDIIRIPNAVNVEHFTQTCTPEQRTAIRRELDLTHNDVALVTTSRLVHKNGIDDVIRSLQNLPKRVKFVIFGTGPEEEKLRLLARTLQVQDRVVFYGFIDHAVMPKYLKACDIFIRPSRSEGMGNSFIEAMAAELPVIATQEGGIADFLFDANKNPDKVATGWAVDADAPDQIVRVVEKILADPGVIESTVKNAKVMAEREYDWNLIASDMKTKVFDVMLQRNK